MNQLQGYDLEWAGSIEEIAAGKALKRTFEFKPNGSDVGKPVAVRQLRATIGRPGCFRAVVSMTLKRDEDLDARARQFFAPTFKQGGISTDSIFSPSRTKLQRRGLSNRYHSQYMIYERTVQGML